MFFQPSQALAGIPRSAIAIGAAGAYGSIYVSTAVSGPENGVCSAGHGDGPPVVRGRLRAREGRRQVTLTFGRDDRPDSVSARVYRHLDRNDLPHGGSSLRRLSTRPTRDATGATTGWRARFAVKLDRPRYVTSAAYWHHAGCDSDEYGFYVYPALVPD